MFRVRVGRLLALLLVATLPLAACQSFRPGSAASSTSVHYNLFFDPADHVKELMKAGQIEEAAAVYQEQRAFFAGKPNTQKLVDELAATLAEAHAPRVAAAEGKLGSLSWPADPSQWQAIKTALAEAEAAVTEVTEHSILTEDRYRPAYLPRLQAELGAIKTQVAAAADTQFLAYLPEGRENFFNIYPVPVDGTPLLQRNQGAILTILGNDSPPRLEAFASTYKALPDEAFRRALGLQLYAVYQKQEGADGRTGLPAVLNAFRATKASGLPLETLPGTRVAVVEVTSQTLLKEKQIEFPVETTLDIPFPNVKADLDAAFTAPEAQAADVLILLDVAAARTDRKITSTKHVASEYQSGTQQVPNPEYNMAQNRVNQAQLDLQRAALNSATTDLQTCYGWGCLGKSIAQIANVAVEARARRNVEAALQALSTTPMSLEEPLYSPYTYNQTVIDAAKEATVNYYVLDRTAKVYFRGTFDTRHPQRFTVNYGLREEDRSFAAAAAATNRESEVIKFEESPVQVRLSELLSQYQQHAEEWRPLPPLEALRTEILAEKNQALLARKAREFNASPGAIPEERLNSVVVLLNPGGKLGAGFYVADDLVLTNFHLIEGTQYVEMKLRNGQETFGKVIAKDIRLDLALIKTQMRGEPVTFFGGHTLPLGDAVLAVGHPKGLEFSVTRGIISALREINSTAAPGGKKILFVQTDAAINPGNSGGPLYLKEWVIGVNTQKLAAVDVQGLGFALHYSEVLNFLDENGVQVRKGGGE